MADAVLEKIEKVAGILRDSKGILFITGAGISADSGLPTYRGLGGLYEAKTTEEGIPIEMALAGEMLQVNPEITWKYLFQIEGRLRQAEFNRAHEIIALMEKRFSRVWVLTQNIDGLHTKAGSRNVIDIHGDIYKVFCQRCSWRKSLNNYGEIKIPPLCPDCGNIVRPDVVFFGERLPQDKLDILYRELKKGFDVYFSIGTTSVFLYIQEPILTARYSGRPTIEINPQETEVSALVDIKIRLKAKEAMELIWDKYSRN